MEKKIKGLQAEPKKGKVVVSENPVKESVFLGKDGKVIAKGKSAKEVLDKAYASN